MAAPPADLAALLEQVRSADGRLVGRAALGLSYLTVGQEVLARLLEGLPHGASWSLLDAPEATRTAVVPWGRGPDSAALELMGRVKARFDPTRTCNPGLFVGGL